MGLTFKSIDKGYVFWRDSITIPTKKRTKEGKVIYFRKEIPFEEAENYWEYIEEEYGYSMYYIKRGVSRRLARCSMGLMMMIMMVAGCGSSGPKKIVIGLDDNFAPMGFRNEKNEIVGMDIDLAREACKRLNMEVEFKPIDWGAKEAELKSKRIDAIWNCFTINPEREKVAALPDLH